jgi:hypothetical protein
MEKNKIYCLINALSASLPKSKFLILFLFCAFSSKLKKTKQHLFCKFIIFLSRKMLKIYKSAPHTQKKKKKILKCPKTNVSKQ